MEKKIVEMKQENKETKAKDNKQPLSYEQLNNICSQLYQENQKLVQQLNQLNMANMFKRLDYLFKVVEFADTIKDVDFINSCIAEIKDSMTIKEESEEA